VKGVVSGGATSREPQTLAVTEVLPGMTGCPNGNDIPAESELRCSSGADEPYILAHGTLMITGWGLLLPSGVIIARLMKHRPNAAWFRYHWVLQITGLTIAFAGWVIALCVFDVFRATGNKSYIHGVLGCTTMSLGILQPLNALLRPHKEEGEEPSCLRRAWEVVHKTMGYTALVLAVTTIAIGTTLVPKENQQIIFQATYGAVGAVLLALIVYLCYEGRTDHKSAPMTIETGEFEQYKGVEMVSTAPTMTEAGNEQFQGVEMESATNSGSPRDSQCC